MRLYNPISNTPVATTGGSMTTTGRNTRTQLPLSSCYLPTKGVLEKGRIPIQDCSWRKRLVVINEVSFDSMDDEAHELFQTSTDSTTNTSESLCERMNGTRSQSPPLRKRPTLTLADPGEPGLELNISVSSSSPSTSPVLSVLSSVASVSPQSYQAGFRDDGRQPAAISDSVLSYHTNQDRQLHASHLSEWTMQPLPSSLSDTMVYWEGAGACNPISIIRDQSNDPGKPIGACRPEINSKKPPRRPTNKRMTAGKLVETFAQRNSIVKKDTHARTPDEWVSFRVAFDHSVSAVGEDHLPMELSENIPPSSMLDQTKISNPDFAHSTRIKSSYGEILAGHELSQSFTNQRPDEKVSHSILRNHANEIRDHATIFPLGKNLECFNDNHRLLQPDYGLILGTARAVVMDKIHTCSVLLSEMKLPMPEVVKAIDEMDEAAFTYEQLVCLETMLPSFYEGLALQRNGITHVPSASQGERFMCMILGINNAKMKLQALLLMKELPVILDNVVKGTELLQNACRDIHGSQTLALLFREITHLEQDYISRDVSSDHKTELDRLWKLKFITVNGRQSLMEMAVSNTSQNISNFHEKLACELGNLVKVCDPDAWPRLQLTKRSIVESFELISSLLDNKLAEASCHVGTACRGPYRSVESYEHDRMLLETYVSTTRSRIEIALRSIEQTGMALRSLPYPFSTRNGASYEMLLELAVFCTDVLTLSKSMTHPEDSTRAGRVETCNRFII